MDAVKKIYQYAEPNLTLVGWMGFIGFPIYYYVWTYLFPQGYESFWLRGFCSLLFAGIAFRHSFPKALQRYLPYYYLLSIGFCLPFFFSFMMLMNDWSTVWAMSFMASIFLHILLVHETKVMLPQAIISVLLAYFSVYVVVDAAPSQMISWTYVPIFIFTYVFGNLFYFRNQVSHESKASLAKSFGAGIAHEMRNPLSALKSSLDVVRTLVPSPHSGQATHIINQQDLQQLHEILNDADEVIHSGNETIDLLLTSIDQHRVSTSTFRKLSAATVVENAIHSFAYKRAVDRAAVSLTVNQDFDFFGSDTLLKFALYNLLKNAFYYQSSEVFTINIELNRVDEQNVITVKDNGIGIEAEQLEEIFKDFYTFGKHNSYGLGLPFCRKVMHSFGGEIICHSVFGEWTQFTLQFPDVESERIKQIKHDLLKSKSILLIGEPSLLSRYLNEQAFYLGFTLHMLTLSQAMQKEAYEFEFDLIFIDLAPFETQWDKLSLLEGQLHFTEARISYIYDQSKRYPINISRYLTIYPIEIRHLLKDSIGTIEKLLFSIDELEVERGNIPQREVNYQRSILLVDDNDSLRTFSAILLEKQGYDVYQAHDGQQALEILKKHTMDLILMDVEMPVIDGLQATNIIRSSMAEYRKTPIIGYTGDNSSETINRLYRAGMNDYIVKPADKDKLLNKVADWL
ncbi:ATP-binding response regulator [Vibrio metschnikovii]|uniref:ATP-binding response regulator n=1 Tax=Vibrio metschnikovii TaxID=28172 RepID=UPI001C301E53|nr:hybrid sensor histidine kinase/response regulator [Vibrio metschnikovii]